MSIDYRSDIRRAIFTLLLIVPLTGMMSCGKKGAAPAAGAEEATLTEGSDVAPDASSWDPNATLGVEERKTLFVEIPDTELSGWDKINKCEVMGECSHVDAVKWKILYFFDRPELSQRFRRQEGEGAHCGNPHFDEIMYEISQSPELREFYEALITESDGGEARKFSLIKDAHAEAAFLQRVTTLDGQFTFTVDRYDADKGQYRQLNRKRTVSAPGGRVFDFYYRDTDETFVAACAEVVTSPETWQTLENEFEDGISALALSGHEHPTFFLVPSELKNGSNGLYYHPVGRRGYVTVTTKRDDAKVRFVRGKKDIPKLQNFKGTCLHELHHFVADGFFRSDQYDHKFVEAHAEWFNHALNGGGGQKFYSQFLYAPHIPFDHPEPAAHKYGVSLFWDFLSCREGDRIAPVNHFNRCIAHGRNSVQCVEEVLTANGMSMPASMLQMAESLANLNVTIGEDDVVMRGCDPTYEDYYLWGIPYRGNPFYLPWGNHQSLEFDVGGSQGIKRFSLEVYAFMDPDGNREHNYLKVDLSDICLKPGMGCSLLGFRINKVDRQQYELVWHKRVMAGDATGIAEHIATDVDGEPDVLLLFVVNANTRGDAVHGKVRLETKPFSRPVEVLIERRDHFDERNGGYTNRVVSYEGTLDVPDASFPLKSSEEAHAASHVYKEWDYSTLSNRNVFAALNSFVPVKSGEVRWDFEALSVEGSCPGNVIKTFRRSQGSRPLSLQEGDNLALNVCQFFDTGEDCLHIGPLYRTGQITTDFEIEQRCEPCCPLPPAGLRNELEAQAFDLTSFSANVPYAPEETTLSLYERTLPAVSGRLILPEPIEQHWGWTTNDHFGGGGLYGVGGAGRLMYQLRPSLIDYPEGLVPARLSQPQLPASTWE